MARNADPHPAPSNPDEGPAPQFPPGAAPPGKIDNLPRPGVRPDETPPERKPFPDVTPDPGITHE